jgi:hypothetical protein
VNPDWAERPTAGRSAASIHDGQGLESPGWYSSKERALMAETWSGEFYCVKCKAKRTADGEVKVNDKGTRMAKAKCPECGTNLNRILGKA